MGSRDRRFFSDGSNGHLWDRQKKIREVVMKFLIVVLASHFLVEVISRKRKEIKNKKADKQNEIVRHPAEDALR